MTPSEASAVIDILAGFWPCVVDDGGGWTNASREKFMDSCRPLAVSTEQAQAAFGERAMRQPDPVRPPEALSILEGLGRKAAAAKVSADTGLIATLRRLWGERDPAWKDANDESVLWGYAWNRCRVSGKPDVIPDPIEQSRAFEFEARCLGWEPQRIRAALLAFGRADGVEVIEREWEEHQSSFTARKAARAAVMAARAEAPARNPEPDRGDAYEEPEDDGARARAAQAGATA